MKKKKCVFAVHYSKIVFESLINQSLWDTTPAITFQCVGFCYVRDWFRRSRLDYNSLFKLICWVLVVCIHIIQNCLCVYIVCVHRCWLYIMFIFFSSFNTYVKLFFLSFPIFPFHRRLTIWHLCHFYVSKQLRRFTLSQFQLT